MWTRKMFSQEVEERDTGVLTAAISCEKMFSVAPSGDLGGIAFVSEELC